MATQPHHEIALEIPPSLLQARPSRATKLKKKLVRRTDRDYSQPLRWSYQFAFLLLNVYLGGVFYLWVRHFGTGPGTKVAARPAGVEGWLPIAGLMNFKYWLATGHVPTIHPAAMFLLIAFLAISFLFRKAFCSWLCPIGTLSEYLWRAGRKLFHRNFAFPRSFDLPLRGLKYLLLGFFLWAVSSMSADAIAVFMRSPYGLIADVKMLNFFRQIGETGVIVLGILVVASVFVQNFWCRYLCPYGALMGLVSLVSPLKVRRDPEACIDCGKCARVCPSHLAVDKLVHIRSAECSACMACVAACPVEYGLQFAALPRKSASVAERWRGRIANPGAVAAMLAVFFLGMVFAARATGHWRMHLPQSVYMQLVPNANQVGHPGMDGPGSTMDVR
jgi:polyferredoxin